MRAYVTNIMVVLIIFPAILQTVINVIMPSIGGQGASRLDSNYPKETLQCNMCNRIQKYTRNIKKLKTNSRF